MTESVLSQPRKVLMTADTVSGVWTSALELSRGLAERGVEVALATMGEPLSEAQRESALRIPGLRVFESAFKLEWMEEPWRTIERDLERAGEWLLRIESRFGPDLVHLNGYAHAALPWSVPKLVVGHSCVLSWWRAVKGEPAPACWEPYAERVAAGLAAADLVVAPSQAMLDDLEAGYGELPQARVIANGRDARLFQPTAKEPVVFAAGPLWDEARNLAALEGAAPGLSWPVYLAGETRQPGQAAGFDTADLRPHHTRLLGRLTPRALAAWLGRSAIYALPARYEPFGLSILEAALAGCALVLGDIPSLRELWRNRALFVPPDDPQALHAALAALIADPDRRTALAAAARSRALERTPERMIEGYLEAYGTLLPEREETVVRFEAARRPVRAAEEGLARAAAG